MICIAAISKSVEKTDRIIRELDELNVAPDKISLMLRRQIISDYLRQLDSGTIGRRVPTAIRSGRLTGLLGLTAGLGAIRIPEIGPLIVTGVLGGKLRG